MPRGAWTRIAAFGTTMMPGTLAVFYYALNTGSECSAPTPCFTAFVLFQFFIVFNARVEYGSAFNAGFL